MLPPFMRRALGIGIGLPILITLLGSCATTTTQDRSASAPETATGDPPAGERWTALAELAPVPPAPDEPLTLDQALAVALTNNPDLAAKRAELGVAQGQLQQAALTFQHNPVFSAWLARRHVPGGTSVGRSLSASFNPFSSPPLSSSADAALSREGSEDFTEFNLEVAQEFEVFGQPEARRTAAQRNRDATVAAIAETAWQLMADVRRAFYAHQVAQRRVALLERQQDAMDEALDLAERRFDAGDIPQTEYRQQQIAAGNVDTERALAAADAESSAQELRRVLGLAAGASLEVPSGLPTAREAPNGVIDAVLEASPKMQRAKLVAQQRRDEAELARRDARPNITGSAFWTREEGDIDIVGAGISLPLPFWNRERGTIAAAEARTTVAERRVQAAEAELRNRAEQILRQYQATRAAVERYERQIMPLIEQNAEAFERAFRVGDMSLFDIRLRQRELLQTERRVLDTLEKHYQWRAELEGLLGRGIGESSPYNSKETSDETR